MSRGFTLAETMLAVIIIGTAILASMTLLGVGTQTNKQSFQLITAINLSETVRERMHGVSYDEAVAEDGSSYSPPLDVRGLPVSELQDWTQNVTVTRVDPDDIDSPGSDTSDMANLTVEIRFRGNRVLENSYLLVKTKENS